MGRPASGSVRTTVARGSGEDRDPPKEKGRLVNAEGPNPYGIVCFLVSVSSAL